MIELPPPQKLRERTAKACLEQDDIHQYRNRLGEEVYRNAIASLLTNHYKVPGATKDNILAISGILPLLLPC
jgi:aspartate/methionine/tyrosine aminotransferase